MFFSRVVKSPNILVEILSHQGFQAPDPEFVVFLFEEGLHGRYIGNKSKKMLPLLVGQRAQYRGKRPLETFPVYEVHVCFHII